MSHPGPPKPNMLLETLPTFFFSPWLHWVSVGFTRAFSSCSKWELLFVAMHRLLIVVASLVAEQGL